LPNDAGAGPATGVTPIPKALIHAYVTLNSLPLTFSLFSAPAPIYINIPALTPSQISSLVSGTYNAGLTLQVFNGTTPIGLSRALTLSLNVIVPRICTVGGTSTPTAGSAAIPISNGRVSSVAPITPTFPLGTSVACTGVGPVSVTLSSQNTRLTGPSNSNPAFANAINYTASASVAGGTAASYTSATGVATAGTAGGTSGALSVSITPVDPGKPLVSGTYQDVLRITITPQ
jgi:hypothetical protein